jgi:peroxiredoxin
VSLGKAWIGVLGSLVGLGFWFEYQLLVQHGRLLLRLEALEQQREQLSAAGLSTMRPPVGSVAHDFNLPALAGGRTTLSQWRGRRLLLVFIDPGCSFSRALLRQLASLPTDTDRGRPQLVIVSTCEAEASRRWAQKLGGQWPILLQEQDDIAALYRVDATPTAYLIDEQGAIASELVTGAQAVLELALSNSSDGPREGPQLSTRRLVGARSVRHVPPSMSHAIRP